jgi:microsomal dipeptidase-like Zn-dependent dipeptidase
MNTFFDLHTHTSLKTMLGGTNSENRKSCWHIVKSKVPDLLTEGILGSQSSLKQMKKGNVKIAITALYSLEKAFADNWLLKKYVTKIENDLSKEYLESISKNKLSPYQNLKDELAHIQKAISEKMNDVQLLSNLNEINHNKINLILATEGLHCFQNSYDVSNEKQTIEDIKTNFIELIKQNRILYTGLTHLTRGVICTHTYAMKLLKGEEYIPQGGGLAQAAKDIIDICYSGTGFNEKKTFIDIKHMGIVSRMQFYEYRTQKGYTGIPIVASHIAVTGRSYNNIKIKSCKPSNVHANTVEIEHHKSFSNISYFMPKSNSFNIDFNPWSLNLYDEEIEQIIETGGILGLILDKRVLGHTISASDKPIEGEEYFSTESFNYLTSHNHFNLSNIEDEIKDSITIDILKTANIGLAHLFANMMHIVKTFYNKYSETEMKYKAWDHICIGSDSDGLISTINGYKDASDFDVISGELYYIFESARKGELKKYFSTLNSDILISKIFYSNGVKFIEKHL